MDGQAIAVRALGHAGLGLLTEDFGPDRPAATLRPPRAAGADGPRRDDDTQAARP